MTQNESWPQLEVKRKTGDEYLCQSRRSLGVTLQDFWRWSASDLVSNAMRGIFAEYIVACALGIADGTRTEWDAFDLLTPSGVKIEVKSSAYLQSWFQKKPSNIIFSIRPTRQWDPLTNALSNDLKRQADVYVFCVLNPKQKDLIDPLNLDQWDFYILRASTLDSNLPTQKTLGLASLLKLHPCVAKYEEIASCIEKVTA